mmetsp:Transcript_67050/g.106122  ORF Transcript_67050/g.106122 Transcript_67050/m.106122 type:complete len:418 (-) Transcript_67050:62-1315(-)
MATGKSIGTTQDDDFFELHLRRMLDAPSFIESPRNVGERMPAANMKSPGLMSEASTRSSDGRGPAEAFAESGYFSSGTAPPYSRSPPQFRQPPYHSRDGGSVVAGPPPPPPPMPSRGIGAQQHSSLYRHAPPETFDCINGFAEVASSSQQADRHGNSRYPVHAHYRAGPTRDAMHVQTRDDEICRSDARHQRHLQPQALVGRMQSEEDDRLLAETMCGFMQPVIGQERGSSRPSSTPVAREKPKKTPKQVPRCLQCGQAAGTSIVDHICPQCSAVVCGACVDDFRLITSSYRCPRCGDEEANQELLQSTAWRRTAFRSARSLYRNLSESWIKLLSQSEDGDVSLPSNCCSKTVAASGTEICDVTPSDFSRTPPPSRALEQQIPRCVTKLPETTQPQHRTRLPVGWEEAMPRQARERR